MHSHTQAELGQRYQHRVQDQFHLYIPELRSLTMILKFGGKVKRADSMARMDMNIISKNSRPLVLRVSDTRSDWPFWSQNRPANQMN